MPTLTEIIDPTARRERREREFERLAEVLHAAIDDRHRLAHRGDRFACSDPVCQALSELQTAVTR